MLWLRVVDGAWAGRFAWTSLKQGANVIVNYASNDKAAKEVVGMIEADGPEGRCGPG